MAASLENLIFVGLNRRVAALDNSTGEIVWEWTAPKPKMQGYVSLLLPDESRLIVSVNGYTYCLNPLTGEQYWFNELKGFGSGVTSIVALNNFNPHDILLAAAAQAAQAAAAGAGGAGGA
jgi:outer membrane protein assembly factor BamB